MSGLTDKDRLIAKRYIICRSAIKGFNKDLTALSELELGPAYKDLIEAARGQATNELNQLKKYPLSCSITDQPTVYAVQIGSRNGFIEMNIVEIVEEIKNFFK